MNVESKRSLRGPSSNRIERRSSRSTAMYRSGAVATAVRKTVCPESRFISPRNLDGPWRITSFPAASRIATSPSTIAMNG